MRFSTEHSLFYFSRSYSTFKIFRIGSCDKGSEFRPSKSVDEFGHGDEDGDRSARWISDIEGRDKSLRESSDVFSRSLDHGLELDSCNQRWSDFSKKSVIFHE